MATATTDTSKSNKGLDSTDVSADIQSELDEIRTDLAALAKSVKQYGKLRVGDMQDRAFGASDEAMEQSRRALKKLTKQMTSLEKELEGKVREHPLQWFLGALGLGLLAVTVLRRPD